MPAHLESITFDSNPITTVEDGAFNGSASTLKSLTFTNALFTSIPTALLQLQVLASLSISDCNIHDWNLDVMTHIGQTVLTLDIDNVNLTTWPSWLQTFTHLTELSIDSNAISDIPDGALDNVASTLRSLSQDSNNLRAIPKALSTLGSLQTLSMIGNQISDTSNLPSRSQLMTLTLTGNRISDAGQLSTVVQPYAESLTVFGLQNNLLPKIPDIDFLSEIEHLDISHNKISDPNSGSLPSGLYDIDASYNLLPYVPTVLASLQSMVELNLPYNSILDIRGTDITSSVTGVDLSHNLITSLTASSFPTVSGIVYLKLNNNPISVISPDAFNSLDDLTELYLGGAMLTRVPLALVSLKNLMILDLTDNGSLVCTCEQRSLGPWMQPLYEGDVRGNCGMLSIYQFFVTLSPACPQDGGIIVG